MIAQLAKSEGIYTIEIEHLEGTIMLCQGEFWRLDQKYELAAIRESMINEADLNLASRLLTRQ